MTVRKVLGDLEEHDVKTAFVNCWSSQTFYSVLEAVFQELRALVAETRDVAFKFERLVQVAQQHRVVIALDEVDQLFLRERNATLYNLSRLPNVGVICLSAHRDAFLALDDRACSRLAPQFVEFTPYQANEMHAILEERAQAALTPESWCDLDLKKIVEASAGDARMAIQSLRTAVYLAEKGRIPQIRFEDIESGLRQSQELRRHYVLKSLSEHHRFIHRLVEQSGKVSSRDLWRKYRIGASANGLPPMARRTFNQYRHQLVLARLLIERQGRGRSNTKTLSVAAASAETTTRAPLAVRAPPPHGGGIDEDGEDPA